MELHSSYRPNRGIARRAWAVSVVMVALSATFVVSSSQAWTPTSPQLTVSTLGGTGWDQVADSAVDSSGNIYAVGSFMGTGDYDPGSATLNLVSAGDTDIFVVKLDSSGDLVWAHRIGGSGADKANSVAVDSAGNVFVTGYFSDTVDFNPAPSNTDNLVSAAGWDAFVLQLSSSGSFGWVQRFGSASGNDAGTAIGVDSGGRPVVSGFFEGSVDFDPHPSTTLSLSAGGGRIFIVKLASSGGSSLWGGQVGGGSNDESTSLAVDTSGATYLSGQFSATRDFNPSGSVDSLTSAGSTDAFLLKLNVAGSFEWAHRFGSTNADEAYSIALDPSGNVMLSGSFHDTVDFNPQAGVYNLTSAGMRDAFIVHMGSDGAFRWARHVGGPNGDYGYSLAVDSSGNVYMTGMFAGSNADFDPGPATNTLSTSGNNRMYVLKLDMLGLFVWANKFGSWGSDRGYSISTDATGNVVVAGFFDGQVAFDPANSSPTIMSAGGDDVFVARMTSSGSMAAAVATTTTVAVTTTIPATTTTAVVTGSGGAVTATTISSIPGVTTTVKPTTTKTVPSATSTTLASRSPADSGDSVTTTTSVSITSTTVDPAGTPPPDDESLAPGRTSITRGGLPTEADVTEENGTLVVTVDGTTLTYGATGSDGNSKAVSKSGFTVAPGDSVSIAISGAGDGAGATVWLKPEDTEVANAVLAAGTGEVSVSIADGAVAGDRRLVLVTSDRSGRELIVAQGLRVETSEASGPSRSTLFLVIIVLGVSAGFFIPAARRRRRDDDVPASPAD